MWIVVDCVALASRNEMGCSGLASRSGVGCAGMF